MSQEPVDLSTNENPLGPSPRVVEAIDREARRVHRYPAREDGTLREALAAHHGHGLTPDHFVTGASASEVLEFVARAALRPGDEGLICSPTFPVYASTAAHQDARVVDVPLDPATGGHHADRILAAVTPRTRLLYICNPGNPTGIRMPAAEFTALLERIPSGIIVVADEVYYQYVEGDFPDTIEQIHAGRDVVIVHSFSKGYGMAGLRLGYGIARPELVRRFARFRLMYHLSGIALAAGIAALADQEHVTRTVALTREGRRYFAGELDRLGIQRSSYQRRGVIRSAATERGGDSGRSRPDESANHRHLPLLNQWMNYFAGALGNHLSLRLSFHEPLICLHHFAGVNIRGINSALREIRRDETRRELLAV